MNVIISGASGLVGTALIARLRDRGNGVCRLVRRQARSDDEMSWDPRAGTVDVERMSEFDAVVNLAGENIASGRWNKEKKQRLRESRVQGTRLLATSAAAGFKKSGKPTVMINASAIGYYGDRGEAIVDEQSPAGNGFLADLCQEWENATAEAQSAGLRVVLLRIGVVLSSQGGALAQMLTPFKLGVGGKVGSGRQYFSWITLDDLVAMIDYVLNNADCSGPVNAVAPGAVTNAEFTKTLGKVLGRPTIFPMPALAARLAFGEMADELLLASTRVAPRRIGQTDFSFAHADLDSALRHVLGKK